MMKHVAIAAATLAVLAGARAQTEPVVGVWEKYAVSAGDGRLIARTNYVFTNVRLTRETVFTAFQNDDPLTLICCIKVRNLTPLSLAAVLKQYAQDREFGEHMQSVAGAPFMYEAVVVDKKERNGLMDIIASGDKDPTDLVPYNALVIAARLGDADEKLGKLERGPTGTRLKITYPKGKNKAVYRFTTKDGRQIVLSEDTFPHD